MQMRTASRAFLPITIIFVVSSAILLFGHGLLQQWGVGVPVLIGGNLVLFAATAVSFFVHFRAIGNKNTQAFLRALYGSMLFKMMICLAAVLIYVSIAGANNVNTVDVLGFMVLYFVYTFTEVAILMKLSKENKHA